LYKDRLRAAVCAQHCNGGIAVDENWQTRVKGLYATGEAAGTFGVYRPGGSALNSTQVGSLRAAEHIAGHSVNAAVEPSYELPRIKYGISNIGQISAELKAEMSRCADHDRKTEQMKRLFEKVSRLLDGFFNLTVIGGREELPALFRLYDTALTQRAVLSAMICSAEKIGTHGSAFVDGLPNVQDGVRTTRTLTDRDFSYIEPVSAMPDPELWFETLLNRQKNRMR
jgi:succinate dehydrogenase/fumarate reductase flavoprotein subunit